MTSALVLRPRARTDLDESAAYLAEDHPQAALRFLAAVEHTLHQLVSAPGLGKLREFDNARLSGLRSWRIQGFEKWLVFYRFQEEVLEVVRVLHGARDFVAVFDDDPG